MKNSTILLIGAGVIAVGGAVAALASLSTSASKLLRPAVEKPGYTVLANCAGLTVHDQAQADAYAESEGEKSSQFSIPTADAWTAAANTHLGFAAVCPIVKSSAGRFLRLFVFYIRGAVKQGTITAEQGSAVAKIIGNNMIAGGVDPKVLQDALENIVANEDPKPQPQPVPEPKPKPAPPPQPLPEPPPPPSDDDLPKYYPGDEASTFILENDADKPPIVAKVFSSLPTTASAPMVVFIGPVGETIGEVEKLYISRDWNWDTDVENTIYWSDGEAPLMAGLAINPAVRTVVLRSGRPYFENKDAFTQNDGDQVLERVGLGPYTGYQGMVAIDLWNVVNGNNLDDFKSPYYFAPSYNESDIVSYFDINYLLPRSILEIRTAIIQLRKVFPTTEVYVVGYSLSGTMIAYQLARESVGHEAEPGAVAGAIVLAGRQYAKAEFKKPLPAMAGATGLQDPVMSWEVAKADFQKAAGVNGGTFLIPYSDHTIGSLTDTLNLLLKEMVK